MSAGASSSLRAFASPSAGVLPSLPFTIRSFTPSTGLPDTALRSDGGRHFAHDLFPPNGAVIRTATANL